MATAATIATSERPKRRTPAPATPSGSIEVAGPELASIMTPALFSGAPALGPRSPNRGHDRRRMSRVHIRAAHCRSSDHRAARDRKSVVSGKSVSVRVDLGGSRIIKKTKRKDTQQMKRQKKNIL